MQDAARVSNGSSRSGSSDEAYYMNRAVAGKPEGVDWGQVRLSAEMRKALDAAKSSTRQENVSMYEGFGSFHSENVEDLINMSDSEYTAPRSLPMFARKVLSKDQLQQLASLKAFSSARYLSRGGRVASSVAGLKRSRTSDDDPLAWKASASMAGAAREGAPPSSTSGSAASTAVSSANSSDREDGASGNGETGADGNPSQDDSGEANKRESVRPGAAPASSSENELLRRFASEPVEKCAMGREFREKHFTINPNVTFINHGAFGSSLAGAMAIKRGYEELMENEVVEFVDRSLLPLIVYSIRSLSRFLKADPRQIVLVQNATFALNCAVQLIEKDDVVAFLDTEYLSVYKMMWFRCQEVGATHHELALSHLLHDEKIMGDDAAVTEEIMRQLPAGCNTIIMDCVTSTSALCLPVFSHIIPALRKRGVKKIIVDGAHGPLQMDLNFAALSPESQPTVFVGNLHKWFSSPKSVGFFWVRAEDEDSVHSVVLSHGAGDGLLSEFIWDGTRDYGAYLSVPAIVDFWEAQDVHRVRSYCSDLLESAAAMLTQAFRSRPVVRHAPFMSLVELPEELQDEYVTSKYIQDLLHDLYAIEVPVKRVSGRYYIRISAFVYNAPQEYLFLKEAVMDIADRWFHSAERRDMSIAATRQAAAAIHQQEANAAASANTSGSSGGDNGGEHQHPPQQQPAVPCDERIRRQGGCGVSGLDPSLKRRKTRKF